MACGADPMGYSDMTKINVGGWRNDANGLMQVLSGPLTLLRVYYEAPPPKHLPFEMACCLTWAYEKGDFDHWRRKVVWVVVSPSVSTCVDGEAMAIAPGPVQYSWVFLASFFLTGLQDPYLRRFSALQTSLNSACAFCSARMLNCLNPITFLIQPLCGSVIHLRLWESIFHCSVSNLAAIATASG